MIKKNVLISGASIAGPALAFWLARAGFSVTVVEYAPGPRVGGNGVDVRDQAIEAVERMGLMDTVRRQAIDDTGLVFVNSKNRTIGSLDFEGIRKEGNNAVEIFRGDLAQILYEATQHSVEYIFGDAVSDIKQDEAGVDVTFERGALRRFDLVVGADGFHSSVRRIVFGPPEKFVRFKQHYFAACIAEAPHAARRKSTIYTEPGKSVMVQAPGNGPSKCYFAFYQKDPLAYHHRDVAHQRRILREAFETVGWDTPMILEQANSDPDFYLDAQAQVLMPCWSHGRVTLVGDAAHCASPFSGAGALLALVGAYRLAGELVIAAGDHTRAYESYEKGMRPLVLQKQAHLFTGIIVPRTRLQMQLRNALVRSNLLKLAFGLEKSKIDPLPEYGM